MKAQAESQGKSYEQDDSELFCAVVPLYKGRRFGTGSEAEAMSDVECSSRISGPTQQEIDSRIKEQLEARFAEQEKQWQTQMANMTSVFTAYMQQVRSVNPSVPLPDFSDFRTPTSAQMNGLEDMF
ncbi:unnamed protein product, partial [Cuscuta epithymum]